MNHQPFENWLLEESPLTPSEKRLLNAHLRECPSCLALAEVSVTLRAAQCVSPPNGFVNRFRQRLASRQQRQHKKVVLGFVLLTLTVQGALLGLSWPFLIILSSNPGHVILEWIFHFITVCVALQALLETIYVLARIGASLIPADAWVSTFLLLSTMCLLGIASLAKLTRIPQGVRL